MSALLKAIEICGSQTELARRIGGKVRTGHIYHWIRNGVPAERCLAIQNATNGQVTCYDLRPDAFPPPENPPARRSTAAKGATAEANETVLTAGVG